MELKQFHLQYHYRGVEIEMLCLTETRYDLIALTGVRNATIKRIAYFSNEIIKECRENPNIVYVRKSNDTKTPIVLPEHLITLTEFQSLVDGYKS
jgi:hypothetical protein